MSWRSRRIVAVAPEIVVAGFGGAYVYRARHPERGWLRMLWARALASLGRARARWRSVLRR